MNLIKTYVVIQIHVYFGFFPAEVEIFPTKLFMKLNKFTWKQSSHTFFGHTTKLMSYRGERKSMMLSDVTLNYFLRKSENHHVG